MFLSMKAFWIFLSTCALAANTGYFYNPPSPGPYGQYEDNPVYTIGKTVQIRWYTSLERFSIIMWQTTTNESEWIQTRLSDVSSYDWIVSTNIKLIDGEAFYLDVRSAADINDRSVSFRSHYFNITDDNPSSSSIATSATQSTASTLSLSPSSTATQSVPTDTAAASSSSQENSGLSNGAKIGVGVGVGLGGAFLAALALFFFLRRRSKNSTQTNASSPPAGSPDPAMISKPYNGLPHDGPPGVSEAPVTEARRMYELQ